MQAAEVVPRDLSRSIRRIFPAAEAASRLAVPASAVAELENGHYVMLIGGDDRLERRPVRVGITRGGWPARPGGRRAS